MSGSTTFCPRKSTQCDGFITSSNVSLRVITQRLSRYSSSLICDRVIEPLLIEEQKGCANIGFRNLSHTMPSVITASSSPLLDKRDLEVGVSKSHRSHSSICRSVFVQMVCAVCTRMACYGLYASSVHCGGHVNSGHTHRQAVKRRLKTTQLIQFESSSVSPDTIAPSSSS